MPASWILAAKALPLSVGSEGFQAGKTVLCALPPAEENFKTHDLFAD